MEEIGFYKKPNWYNPHLGSIISFGKDPQLKYKREIFAHNDESLFAVDWYPEKPKNEIKNESLLKICVFCPALGGNSNTVSL